MLASELAVVLALSGDTTGTIVFWIGLIAVFLAFFVFL
jgi:hypothetical protein